MKNINKTTTKYIETEEDDEKTVVASYRSIDKRNTNIKDIEMPEQNSDARTTPNVCGNTSENNWEIPSHMGIANSGQVVFFHGKCTSGQ